MLIPALTVTLLVLSNEMSTSNPGEAFMFKVPTSRVRPDATETNAYRVADEVRVIVVAVRFADTVNSTSMKAPPVITTSPTVMGAVTSG